MFDFRLRNAPRPLKVMVAGYLLCLGLAYVYALGNIALVVGLSPRDIAIHYYGSDVVMQAETPQAAEEAFDLEAMSDEPPAQKVVIRPSFKNLVQEGHFHLFGMTSFFFGLTLLALFTGMREPMKSIFVGLPYVSIAMDNLSFMATRFGGPHFAYLTALSGAFMGICFTVLWLAVGFEILKNGEKV
jgi:hypothetical protein